MVARRRKESSEGVSEFSAMIEPSSRRGKSAAHLNIHLLSIVADTRRGDDVPLAVRQQFESFLDDVDAQAHCKMDKVFSRAVLVSDDSVDALESTEPGIRSASCAR